MMNKTLTGIAAGATLLVGAGVAVPIYENLTAKVYTGCNVASVEIPDLEVKLKKYKVRDIDSKLRNLNANERADFKACEIVKKKIGTVYTSGAYMIEIVGDIEKIEGGVQVFARAWKNGKQLGFGADDSIDIERFRIYNPPVLVDDPNGTIVREWQNLVTKEFHTIKLREDHEQALVDALFGIIKETGGEGGKIIAGSRGNTTSTFYPSAGATSPVDGYAGRDSSVSYADTHDGAGEVASAVATILATQNSKDGVTYAIYRSPVLFDTSAIPDTDTISSATLTVFTEAVNDGDSDGTVVDVSNPASTANVVAGDYDIANWASVAQSNTVLHSTRSAGTSFDLVLNATGIGNISKTGITKFGLRSSNDLANVTPTALPYHYERSVDYTGTANDPKLVVEHAAGGGGGTPAPRIIEPIITWW